MYEEILGKRKLAGRKGSRCALNPTPPSRKNAKRPERLTCGGCAKVFASKANLESHQAANQCAHTAVMERAKSPFAAHSALLCNRNLGKAGGEGVWALRAGVQERL